MAELANASFVCPRDPGSKLGIDNVNWSLKEREPANISLMAADSQTQMRRDVLKGLGMDDQVWNMLSPKMRCQSVD